MWSSGGNAVLAWEYGFTPEIECASFWKFGVENNSGVMTGNY